MSAHTPRPDDPDQPDQPAHPDRSSRTENTVDGGLDGSNLVQARTAHTVFDQRTVPVQERPMEVAVPPTDFVNHEATIAWLNGLLDKDATTRVVLCKGPLGIGKKSLARRFAQVSREYFTGGQLHVEYVRGVRESSDEALSLLLLALGTDHRALPSDPGAWAGMYRTRTEGRRLLVVVEGAWEAAQVRALIPQGSGSLVLVTGGGPDLEGDLDLWPGVSPRDLDPLGPEASRELLEHRTAPRPLSEEDPESVDHLLRVCGGLPLALVLVGGQLRRLGPGSAAAVAGRLRGTAGVLRAMGDDRYNLEAFFQASYDALTPGAARLYEALGRWPGERIDLTVVAAVEPGEAGSRLLAELRSADLLGEDGNGAVRFRHDLIRRHALERAQARDAGDTAGAVRRMLDAYLVKLGFAELAVRGGRLRVVDLDTLLKDAADPFSGNKDTARLWLNRERPTLLATVLQSKEAGLHGHTARLAELATALYLDRRHVYDWALTGIRGADAARLAGDAAAEARLASLVSRPLTDLGRIGEARERIMRAVELVEAEPPAWTGVDVDLLRGSVLEFLGRFHTETGDHRAAIEAFDRSVRHNEASGHPESVRGTALATLFRGRVRVASGAAEQGAADIRAALAALESLPEPDRRMAARARAALGNALAAQDRHPEAVAELNRAVGALVDRSLHYYAAEALLDLARAWERCGSTVASRESLERARDLFRETGSPRAEEVTRLLAG